jgi:hypothetical protein
MKRFTLIFALMIAIPFAASAQTLRVDVDRIYFTDTELGDMDRSSFTVFKMNSQMNYDIEIVGQDAKMFRLVQLDGPFSEERNPGFGMERTDATDSYIVLFEALKTGSFNAEIQLTSYKQATITIPVRAFVEDRFSEDRVALPGYGVELPVTPYPSLRPTKARLAR